MKLGRGDAQAAAELAAVAMEAAPADAAFVLGRLALAAGRPPTRSRCSTAPSSST
ncbi:MAG: hypothetical protein H6703_04220 [Myxococcales bacterium]|nr:hypothetical protein [Myxococcales bacterium]